MPQKHEKSFSSQPLFVKLELCHLCTSMPNPICVTGNAIHESHCSHCWGELINCFNGAMSIRFKPILGGAFYPFWEGLRVSLVQMGALSRTKVDEWTTLTCNPDILSSWNLKYSQFLSIRDSLKEKPSVGYSHKPRKIYNWSNWLITSVFGSLIGTPYFGRSGSLLAHSVGSLCHEKLGPYLVLISRIGRSDWKRDPGT